MPSRFGLPSAVRGKVPRGAGLLCATATSALVRMMAVIAASRVVDIGELSLRESVEDPKSTTRTIKPQIQRRPCASRRTTGRPGLWDTHPADHGRLRTPERVIKENYEEDRLTGSFRGPADRPARTRAATFGHVCTRHQPHA